MPVCDAKLQRLRERVRSAGSAVVGLSGGVDSALLAFVANQELGRRCVAVTAVSPSLASEELRCAEGVAAEIGIRHISIRTDEMDLEDYVSNGLMRCFHCKTELSSKLREVASCLGFREIFIGVNSSDFSDFRPGIDAARREGIAFPLAEAGIAKEEVRQLARFFGISVSERPSNACLSSRIQYGQRIDAHLLSAVEQAESYLRGLGAGTVRVRVHGDIARIETDPSSIHLFLSADSRGKIVARLKQLNFRYIVLDLEGYRSGSMNPGNAAFRNSR